MEFVDLVAQCAPMVHVQTMHGLVKTESSFNPYAIGVVKGRLERQPRSLAEAVSTVASLESKGYNYSVGYAQVNKHNFKKYGLSIASAFEPCTNLRAGGMILAGCFTSAKRKYNSDQSALRAALSCYYSGNFLRGFVVDFKGQPSYVDKVISNATGQRPVVRQLPGTMPRFTAQMPIMRKPGIGAGWDGQNTGASGGASPSALVF